MAINKLLSKGIEFSVVNHDPRLTGQRRVLWCTPWACEEAGRRTHSSAQASRGDDLRREGPLASCAEPQTKWPPFAPPVLQCGHVILDHWRTPPKKMAEKKMNTRNKMVHDSIFLTSGPTMDRGSVMVATISLATSIASWPTQTHNETHMLPFIVAHTQHFFQMFE